MAEVALTAIETIVMGDTEIAAMRGTVTNDDGDLDDYFSWPDGWERVHIFDVALRGQNAATLASLTDAALRVFCSDPNGQKESTWERLAPLKQVGGNDVGAYTTVGMTVNNALERLRCQSIELDTNAAPTVDLQYLVTAGRRIS